MKTAFTSETIDSVLNGDPYLADARRTPLNLVDPDIFPIADEDFEELTPVTLNDPAEFNAIGSRSVLGKSHQPVIDLPGGAQLQGEGGKRVRIDTPVQRTGYQIGLSYVTVKPKVHSYGPNSFLRDVLGDNGIDLEVFEVPVTEHAQMDMQTRVLGQHVTSIVLRSQEPGVFDVAEAEPGPESHLYIQQRFSEADHAMLINELGELGLINPRWQALVEKAGMSIVPTPWHADNARQAA